MKSRLRQLKRYISSKKSSRKNFILSVVALVEVLAILVVSTYAWVESASTIVIESIANQPIDSYVYTDANMRDDATNTAIRLDKYYRESGNMHLASAASADGNSIYFPRLNAGISLDNKFRQGGINDANTNYISFKFKVTASLTDSTATAAKFIFQKAPVIKVNGKNIAESTNAALKNSVRIAVNDGIMTKVYSNVALSGASTDGNVVNINGGAYYPITYAFSDYSGSGVPDANRVLTVDNGQSKIVTLTVWLQDPEQNFSDAQIEIEDFSLILDTSSSVPVYFEDYTTRFNTSGGGDFGWVASGDTKMFIKDGNTVTEMTKNENPSNRWEGLVEKQSLLKKRTLEFYCCPVTATAATAETDYICKWSAPYDRTYSESDVYFKAYGTFKDAATKLGCGTWDALSEIRFAPDSEEAAALAALPLPTTLDNMINVTLKTNGGASGCDKVEMTFDNSSGYNCWRAYVPKTETNPVFSYTYNSTNYTYNAVKRSASEDVSQYFTTSDKTGYWQPPATIKVNYGTGVTEAMGAITASGGAPNAKTVKVTAGTEGITLTATPTDTPEASYAFLGWYNDAACTEANKLTTELTYTVPAPEASKTYNYYAKFKRQYKVILHAVSDETMDDTTGGTVQQTGGLQTTTAGARVETNVLEGESVTITASKKVSHSFGGWYYMPAEGNYVEFDTTNAEKTFAVNKDYVLYAKFNIRQFTIESQALHEILDGSSLGSGGTGGKVTINHESEADSAAYITVTVNYGGTATFRAFAKDTDGYKFDGWYTDEACTSQAPAAGSYTYASNPYTTTINDDTAPGEKLKLYAKFVLKTYTATAETTSTSFGKVCLVTGTTEGTAANSVSKTIKHGESVTFRAKAVNSTFAGWYTAATGGEQISTEPDLTFAAPAYLTSGTSLNVYARFTPNTYAATAHAGANGKVKVGTNALSAAGGTSTVNVEHGGSTTFYAEANEGYEFKGWYASSDYSGDPVSTSASYEVTGITAAVDYYAKFELIPTFTVTAEAGSNGQVKVNDNSWSTGTSTVTVNSGSSVTFNAQPSDSNAYLFDGWYTAANGGGTKVSSDATFTVNSVTGNLHYYAYFTKIEKITYYFQNTDNWDTPKAYTWRDSDSKKGNGGWPGTAMTKVEGTARTYSIEVPAYCDKIIFSNDGSSQTGDITLPQASGKVYVKSSNSWIDYTGPYRTIYIYANGYENNLPDWYWNDSCQPAIKPAGSTSTTITHTSVSNGFWCFDKCPYDAYDIYCYRHNSAGDYNGVSLGTPSSSVNAVTITYSNGSFSHNTWYTH